MCFSDSLKEPDSHLTFSAVQRKGEKGRKQKKQISSGVNLEKSLLKRHGASVRKVPASGAWVAALGDSLSHPPDPQVDLLDSELEYPGHLAFQM